jgi:hypothetical protein
VVDVEWVPVWAEAGALAHGAALRIERAASTDYALFAEPADPAVARAVAGPAPAFGTEREPQRPVPNATWRVGEFETDARMLFFRMDASRQVTRLALVDGSIVRGGRRRLQLALPRVAPDLHLRLNGDARVAGPSLGARLIVGGHERALALDRRSGPRS